MHARIGDLLVAKGLITLDQLDTALALQAEWGLPLGEVILAKNYVRPQQFYGALAEQFSLPLIDTLKDRGDPDLLDQTEIDFYTSVGILPWRRIDGELWVLTCDPGARTVLEIGRRYGSDCRIAITTKFDISWSVQRTFESYLTGRALNALADQDPENSARTVFSVSQLAAFYLILCLFGLLLIVAPGPGLILFNLAMSLFFLGNFVLKTTLVWHGGAPPADEAAMRAEIAAMRDPDLPVYTVLVPMFREPEVLPILASALRKMDYPIAKLDIKLVLEAGDHETIKAARDLGLEAVFEIVRVPPSQPQTKPKACNYALHLARGEYLVIFDAEDKPEPDQLKKVLAAFRHSPPNTVCIQGCLNYFNSHENWLTRMFTLDYSLWFDLMLPGLEKLKIPIPLGGTSNHFKTSVLRELYAWDPYNVTEDADLGTRISQKGYRVGTVASTTFEEANCSIPNWIRQRSRWLKGYMQTWLVHMRHPIELYQTLGPVGFFGFQFFIGGTVAAALMNPIFWAMYLSWLVIPGIAFNDIFPPAILYMSLFNLLIGNATFIYLSVVAPVKRGLHHLILPGLTVFGYWVLLSIAAYKGLWQLIHKPFFWEKTQHGISKVTAQELANAKAEMKA